MATPEFDLALICEDCRLAPTVLGEWLEDREGFSLQDLVESKLDLRKDHCMGILAAAESAGAISEVADASRSIDKRLWFINKRQLKELVHDSAVILGCLADFRRMSGLDTYYRVAATIPEKFLDLQRFFGAFEQTALGFRRLIEDAEAEVAVLTPFIDAVGLSEIVPVTARALERGIEVTFLIRNLDRGSHNMTFLSELISKAQSCEGRLLIYEAMLSDGSPISHAKVLSRDAGSEVYIGSANLTAASMERTIEIGVFLRGENARPVHDFVSLIRSLSSQRWPCTTI